VRTFGEPLVCVCACMSKLASLRVPVYARPSESPSLRDSESPSLRDSESPSLRDSESPSLKKTNPVDPSLLSSQQFFDNPRLIQFLCIPSQVF